MSAAAARTIQDTITERLARDFGDLSRTTVRDCVDDLWHCCAHIGKQPDAPMIERLAVSRLTGMLLGGVPGGHTASRESREGAG